MPDTLRAVLFDLDDTLLDWSGSRDFDWAELNRERLGGMLARLQFNGRRPPREEDLAQEYYRRIMRAWEAGRSDLRAPHLGRILVETMSALDAPAELLDEGILLRALPWGAFPGVMPFEDAPAALQLLHDNDIRVSLVTNAHQPMWLRDRELAESGLLPLLPTCRFSAADVGWLKPHPRIFETALACVGAQPQEAVFVGDNPVADISGAQNLGMRAVLRAGHQAAQLQNDLIEPDYRLHSLEELPDALDVWFPGWRK